MPDDTHDTFEILLIEGSQDDADRVIDYFAQLGEGEFTLERVATLEDGLRRLAFGGVDIILLELDLPDSPSAIATLRAVCDACRDASPLVVVLTGIDDQDVVKAAIEDCASDFLIKDEITPRSLIRTLRQSVQRHSKRIVDAINTRGEVSPIDAVAARRVLRRSNRVAAMSVDSTIENPTVVDLTTASHAAEIVFGDLDRKLDLVLEKQRHVHAKVAELTVQARKHEVELTAQSRRHDQADQAHTIEVMKLRGAVRSMRRTLRPLVEVVHGGGAQKSMSQRVDALEDSEKGWRRRDANRHKTIRDIFVQIMPTVLIAIGGSLVSLVTWYVTKSAK